MKKTYAEKLLDPRWQRRRLEIFESSEFTCDECGDKKKTLHVHHLLYRKGANPWEYDDSELQCLCCDCHLKAEERRMELLSWITRYSHIGLEEMFICAMDAVTVHMGECDWSDVLEGFFECANHLDLIQEARRRQVKRIAK